MKILWMEAIVFAVYVCACVSLVGSVSGDFFFLFLSLDMSYKVLKKPHRAEFGELEGAGPHFKHSFKKLPSLFEDSVSPPMSKEVEPPALACSLPAV